MVLQPSTTSRPHKSVTLFHHMAQSMNDCINSLISRGEKTYPDPGVDGVYCNATWDTILCWPATKHNTTTSLPCPPLKGLDPQKNISRLCLATGLWNGSDTHPGGWTNYRQCMTPDVKQIIDKLDERAISQAQEIARGTRKLEFVGLGLSFLSLTMAVLIFCSFRRLRVFRNQLHLQLMLALLMVVIIRLILYVDLLVTEQLGNLRTADIGATINTKPVLCEAFYFLLEYFKTVTFTWMFMEGFYLHNAVVVRVFSSEPHQIYMYLAIGWGVPIIPAGAWIMAVLIIAKFKPERCLGAYYLSYEFMALDALRMCALVVNSFFLLNIVRVLWLKVRETHTATELEQLKKSVKAAVMLVPLLGIPNIMQTIPFTPTKTNIEYFAVYTYIASIFYMFQGFMIATIYCFTNREVIHVLKSSFQRFRLTHTTADGLRRGSRAASVHYQCATGGAGGAGGGRNGVVMNLEQADSPLLTKTEANTWNNGMTGSGKEQTFFPEPPPPPYPRAINPTNSHTLTFSDAPDTVWNKADNVAL